MVFLSVDLCYGFAVIRLLTHFLFALALLFCACKSPHGAAVDSDAIVVLKSGR